MLGRGREILSTYCNMSNFRTETRSSVSNRENKSLPVILCITYGRLIKTAINTFEAVSIFPQRSLNKLQLLGG